MPSVEFILFACVLAGVALFHTQAMRIAVAGAIVIALYKVLWSPFKTGAGLPGLGLHLQHEWVILVNLLLLLLGFALLADLFEKSKVPAVLPAYLPDDWKGAFLLLVLVFVGSSFLDNIAAAMIGGAMAHTVFRGKVHIGYLAAIVAASNGGGAGSVVGDTTTTMMWIAGVNPLHVLEAFIGSSVALFIFGIPAAFTQQRYSPIIKEPDPKTRIDGTSVAICFSEPLDDSNGALSDEFTYLINGSGESVLEALVQPDGRTVVVLLSRPVTGSFEVILDPNSEIKDRSGNALPADGRQANGAVLGLTLAAVGPLNPATPTGLSCASNAVQITAGGLDLGNAGDAFGFASRTISGDGEYAGPGAPGSFDDSDSEGSPTTSTSTLFALCIKACTHIHAKDCDGAPAHAAEACWAGSVRRLPGDDGPEGPHRSARARGQARG